MVPCHEVGFVTPRQENDCARWEAGKVAGPQDSILGPVKSPPATMSLLSKSVIQLRRSQRAPQGRGGRYPIAKRPVITSSTEPAGSMTGRQSHGIVEKEDRSPGSGSIERLSEVFKLRVTDDPE